MKPITTRKRWRLACAAIGTATLAICANLPAQTVPPFTDVDLGSPASAGSVVTNADGSLTVTAGGTDIWGTSDQCNYFYTTLTESQWSMQIKINSDLQNGDVWAKCEVMCRNDATPAANDAFVAMMYTKPSTENWLIDQFRTVAGGNADWYHPNPQVTYKAPLWIDLLRNGEVFSFFYSFDNVSWIDALDIDTSTNAFTGNDNGTSFGPTEAFGATVTAGVAVTCHYGSGDTPTTSINISQPQVYYVHPISAIGTWVPLKNCTNYAGCEANFSFMSTNNGSPPQTYANATLYQWYKNGTAIAGATGTDLNFLIDPNDPAANGSKVYCQVTIAPPYNGTIKGMYSTTNTLTVLPGVAYYTNGVKLEYWANSTLAELESGNIGPATWIGLQPSFDHPGIGQINYATRNSGWFIPPATDKYVFFVASDDNSDLFLSTDDSMKNKTLIAQEPGYSGYDSWIVSGDGAATSAPQKRSDQWTAGATGVNPPWANGIPLTKGQPYYIELDHQQVGGGDDFSVTYQTMSQIATANWATNFNDTATIIAGTNGNIMLATWKATQANFTWAQEPVNMNVTAGGGANFIAKAASDGEFTPAYQWYRGSAPIAGATGTAYYLANCQSADNNATFFAVASQEGLTSITSAVVTLTVGGGIWEPGFALQSWWYGDDPTAADNLAILEAFQMPLPSITVACPAVEGRAINNTGPNDDNGQIVCWVVPPATGNYTFYCNSDDACDLFLSTDNTAANKRMIAQEVGWSNPRQWTTANGGNASQKCSDTFIPPNGTTAPNPNGIRLTKGVQYYLELDHVNYTGGDNCEATAEPTGTPPNLGDVSTLTGSYIGYYFPRCSWVAVTNQPVSISNAAPFTQVTFTAGGDSDSQIGIMGVDYPDSGLTNYMFYQWTVNGTAVPGVTGTTCTIEADPWNNNAQVVCQMRALGYANAAGTPIWSNSATAVLTVKTNSATPAIAYASTFMNNGSLNVLDIRFNKPMNPTSLLGATYSAVNASGASLTLANPLVFTNGSSRLSKNSQVLSADQYASVQLNILNLPSSYPYTVTVTGAKDAWGNALTANTATVVQSTLVDTDIGTPPADPVVPGVLWVNGPGAYTIQCEGSDIWNAADGFNFAYQQMTGDFDVVVRVVDDSHTSDWCKAGLMVRETLDAGSRDWNVINDPVSSDGIAAADGSGGGANDIEANCRPAQNGNSVGWQNGYYGEAAQYPNAWLRLKRTGQNLYCYYSNDGANWLLHGQASPLTAGDSNALPATVYVGICQTAHSNDANPPPAWTSLLYLATCDYDSYNPAYVEAPATQPVPALVTGTPAIAFASFYTNNNLSAPEMMVDLKFNKPMDPASLTKATYSVAGLTVTGINVYTNASMNLSPTSEAVSNNYSSVLLTVTGTPKLPLAVTVTGAQDYWANALASPGNAASANLCALVNQDIGAAGDPAVPSVMWVNSANAYSIQCEGSDQWNNADGFNFSYTELSGDFDVVVRVKDNDHTSNWSKAGLMVREDLTPGSRNWNIVNDPDSSDGIMAIDNTGTGASAIEANCRNTTAGSSGSWQVTSNGIAPAYPNAWVRLQRTGTQLAGYYSTDGTNWTQRCWDDPTTIGGKTALPQTVYVGISQSAHNNDSTPLPPFANLAFLDTTDYDNFNAAYVPSGTTTRAKITIMRSGSNVIISWTPAGGTLYSSPALGANAKWTAVANPSNPMTIPIGPTSEFYRLQY
jgi:hypothetical protein